MNNLQSFKLVYLLVLICLATFSCKDQAKEADIQQKITVLYQEASDVEQKILPYLESLIQKKNGINIQGRGLSPEEITFVKEVENIEMSFGDWQKNHIKWSPEQLLKDKSDVPSHQVLSELQKSKKEALSISNKIEALQK